MRMHALLFPDNKFRIRPAELAEFIDVNVGFADVVVEFIGVIL